MRILVPLDGSELAERAIEPAVHLLRRAKEGKLTLLRVCTSPMSEAYTMHIASAGTTELLLNDIAMADMEYLHHIAQRPLLQGVDVKLSVIPGFPAQAICTQAQGEQADLIVMTSHGRTGLMRLALGSVAETVIQATNVPTLLVRSNGQTFPDIGRYEPFAMLVPLDGTPLAETALLPAQRLAQALGGEIRLLRVLPLNGESADEQRVCNREAFAYLTTLHDRLQARGIMAHRSLAWGEPESGIIQETQTHHVDMVVMATHSRTGWQRAIKGSVAATILHTLNLPMLLVHPASVAVTA